MFSEKIAVLIPCYNEEQTITTVVEEFKKNLPEAVIYVFDNNSTDNSYNLAVQTGAKVVRSSKQGKGNVMRQMFCQIEADYYVLVDADNTYPADKARSMITSMKETGVDMVCGDRLSNASYKSENKRMFHSFGNSLVKNSINFLFRSKLKDIMTGYRVFNRKFVKNMPMLSEGFEVETEMTLNALDKGFSILEIPIDYRDRPAGSFSKLNTYRDGFRVIMSIIKIYKDYKPLLFYSLLSLASAIIGTFFVYGPILEYFEFKYVYKVPSLIFAITFYLISFLLLSVGLILDTVKKYHSLEFENDLLKFK